MTPTTPPAIPSDIPAETWGAALCIWAEMRTVNVNSRTDWCHGDVEAIAREIIAVFMGLEVQWLADPERVDLESAIRDYIDRLIRDLAP